MGKQTYLSISGFFIITVLLFGACSGKDEEVDGTGIIEATEVKVPALQSGTLLKLEVEEGENVEKGEVLARIDDEILRLRLQQAESREKQAQAQLELLIEGPHAQDLRQAMANLEQAEEQVSLAKKEWERIETLYNEGTATKQQYESAEANLKISQARREAALAGFEKLKHLARPQEVLASKEAVNQAAREVDILKRQIKDCSIESPIDGMVTEMVYEEGEMVQAGRAVMMVRKMEDAYVTVYLPEPVLAKISVGEEAEVYVDGYPERSFPGRVSYINQEAEFTPKNVQTKEQRVKLVFAVKIEVQNEEHILKPGMPADVVLIKEEE